MDKIDYSKFTEKYFEKLRESVYGNAGGPQYPRCHQGILIHVHGHYQCSACGQIAEACCEGEAGT